MAEGFFREIQKKTILRNLLIVLADFSVFDAPLI
jgi:hypothetical protein